MAICHRTMVSPGCGGVGGLRPEMLRAAGRRAAFREHPGTEHSQHSCGVYKATTATMTARLTPAAAHKYLVSLASFNGPTLWFIGSLRQRTCPDVSATLVLSSRDTFAHASTREVTALRTGISAQTGKPSEARSMYYLHHRELASGAGERSLSWLQAHKQRGESLRHRCLNGTVLGPELFPDFH